LLAKRRDSRFAASRPDFAFLRSNISRTKADIRRPIIPTYYAARAAPGDRFTVLNRGKTLGAQTKAGIAMDELGGTF
jgi:hypothetical protein